MSERLEGALQALGEKMLDDVKGRLADRWDQLPDVAKENAEATLKDMGELLLLKASGSDVDQEIAEAMATLANWTFVGRSLLIQEIKGALVETASLVGYLLRGFAQDLAQDLKDDLGGK